MRMPETLTLTVDGKPVSVGQGTTVAAAVLIAGVDSFRRSISGEARGPLCGMGICFECRVTIDDLAHCRSCQILCRQGMTVTTV
jgi:aerobic-type carbon monoxide dehydrogenase small subunit (CoxS/CutS family)